MTDAGPAAAIGPRLSTRQLGTDAEESIVEVQRPVLLTAIEAVVTQPPVGDDDSQPECAPA
jgi:hypothetical protein